MRKIVLPIIFILAALCIFWVMRANAKPKCPTVSIVGPDARAATQRSPWRFDAVVGGIDPAQISYKWEVLLGTDGEHIPITGQDTKTITFERKDDYEHKGVTVTVTVSGFPDRCSKQFTWSIETPKSKCPTRVRIAEPETREDQEIWTLEAVVEGQTTGLSYKWTLIIGHEESSEDIHSGQGTSKITISKPDLQKGATVFVEIGGLPKGCFNRPTWSIIS